MGEIKTGDKTDSGWKFPTNALEGIRKLWGGKKESEPPRTVSFSVLDQLQNTDKKSLISTFNYLTNRDKDDGSPDISAHIIELLKDEIAKGEIVPGELRELAPLLVAEFKRREEQKNNKKNKRSGTQPDLEKQMENDRILALAERVSFRIREAYGHKKIFGSITAEEQSRMDDPSALDVKSKHIAELIVRAPARFDAGLATYMENIKAATTKKEQEFFDKKRVALAPNDIKIIFELHPNDYEKKTGEYEEVFARAKILSATGMPAEAEVVKNLSIKFSPIDGARLQSPDDRLKYIEALQNPNDLKNKWRREKPDYYSKEWVRDFIAQEIIPIFIANNSKFADVAKQIHWFQVAGSHDQREAAQKLNRDIAGTYRQEHVSVGSYPAPEYKDVEKMMAKLEAQIDIFSQQIENLRATTPPDILEQKVHQYACYVSSQFTAIHPMVDGNGRTSRSLREYIIAKHLGMEKIPQYAGTASEGRHYNDLLECLRYSPITITEDRINTYYGSDLATKYRASTNREEQIKLGIHHEPLMAHLEQTDIQKEVFDNKAIINFAMRAKEIIDAK